MTYPNGDNGVWSADHQTMAN